MIDALDLVCLAIWRFEGDRLHDRATRNCNPGNLRPPIEGLPQDQGGYRIFPNMVDGFAALRADVEAKFTGHNKHGLGPSSTLQQFFNIYAPAADKNDPAGYARTVAVDLFGWLNKPIHSQTLLCQIWTVPETQGNG